MRLFKTLIAVFALWWAALTIYDSIFPPASTLMVGRLLTLHSVERRYVRLNKISSSLVRAVVAAEDGKFCSHHGVDWASLHGAVKTTLLRDPDRAHGASTISMQVVKNLYLWPGRSYLRKGIEIPLALATDMLWGKRKVMEIYLNVAEFGPGIYGAEAAARHYFKKPAAALSAREAALLAASLPRPQKRNPARPGDYQQAYAGSILARMGGVDAYCVRR